MTMQEALRAAEARGTVYAKPIGSQCVFRYADHGRHKLIEVTGRNRLAMETGFWRTMSQAEIEADWMLCDVHGCAIKDSTSRGPAISDLLTDEAFRSRSAQGI